MLVLLWGLAADTPLAKVREQLQLAEIPTRFIDQCEVLETDVRLHVGSRIEASISVRGETLDLNAVTAVYVRTYDSRRLPAIAREGPESPAWQHAALVDDILSAWSDLTPAFVVNRACAMAGNDSKPYQLAQIHRLGWNVPETLVTTDPAEARAFWERHGDVVYKSVSSVRSRVSRLRLEHLPRFADIASCPTQFQRYIAGQDYRVHVVGREAFACEVLSDADDYRYDGATQIRACLLPEDLAARCVTLAAALDLPLAGIDLRCTAAGEWFCFEVNPSPGFSYYEDETGQPIGRAVARLLADAGKSESHATADRIVEEESEAVVRLGSGS